MIEIQANFISIHKALAGLDSPMQYIYKSTGQFQSTRPSRASTPRRRYTPTVSPISIHKALAGLDDIRLEALTMEGISIHKALAGLDEERIP